MLRPNSSWIALAVTCLLGTQHCDAKTEIGLEIPGIFEVDKGGPIYLPQQPGTHTDPYSGSIATPLLYLQITFFSTGYTDAEFGFDMLNATIVNQSFRSDRVNLTVASEGSTGFFGEFEFVNIQYSAEQEFHTTHFEVLGLTAGGNIFSGMSDPVTFIPEPSWLLLMSVLAIPVACQRSRTA